MLRCKNKDVVGHWREVARQIARAIQLDATDVRLSSDNLTASILWSSAPEESADRQIGPAARVVPLASRVGEIRSPGWWLSWEERWRATGTQKIEFSSASLTFYFGSPQRPKTQMLRAEWVGPDALGAFQGAHAAHPHWHIDATCVGGLDTNDLLLVGELDALPNPSALGTSDVSSLDAEAVQIDMGKLHLAMTAAWLNVVYPGTADLPCHQFSPESLQQLQNWTTSTCMYAASELARLEQGN